MEDIKLEDMNSKKEEAYDLYLEARGYFKRGAYYAAVESLKEAKKIFDFNDKELFVKIRILLSRCYRKLRFRMLFCTALEEAEKCAKEAYTEDPNNPKVNVEIASVYYDLASRLKFPLERFIEEKEKCLYHVENGNNSFKESWQKKLNAIEAKFQRVENSLFEARNFLKNAIRLNPSDISYKYRLGAVYHALRHHEGCEFEAVKLFEEVLLNEMEFRNYYKNILFERLRAIKTLGGKNGL